MADEYDSPRTETPTSRRLKQARKPKQVARSPELSASLWAALYALLLTSAIAASGQPGFSRSVTPGLVAHYAGRFGPGVRERLEGWKEFVRATAGRTAAARTGEFELLRVSDRTGPSRPTEVELLGIVNRFFNRVPSSTDPVLWGVADYWATPSETLSIDGADCEDYAIAKYYALKELGVPIARLRLVYAKTWLSSQYAHMVLAYYPEPRADPLILDNLAGSIQLASDRPDLTPVYSFNDDDLQVPDAGIQISGSSVRQWRDVLQKLDRELTY
jgi:predicted transglutaminase-like cysteine proteinase